MCIDELVQIVNQSSTDHNPIVKVEWAYDLDVNTDLDRVENNAKGIGQTHSIRYPYQITRTRTVRIRLVVHSFTGHTDVLVKTLDLLPRAVVMFFGQPESVCITAEPIQLMAREITGLEGVGVFEGKGVTAEGLFTPSVANVGVAPVTYTFTPESGCPRTVTHLIEVTGLPLVYLPDQISLFEKEDYQIKPEYYGKIKSYHWLDEEGKEWSNEPYPKVNTDEDLKLKLVLENELGCISERDVNIVVYKEIVVYDVFSPNGDGINDVWQIPNLEKYGNLANLKVFNRHGQLVYESVGYDTPWNGFSKGHPLPLGTYFYVITKPLGQRKFMGSITILK